MLVLQTLSRLALLWVPEFLEINLFLESLVPRVSWPNLNKIGNFGKRYSKKIGTCYFYIDSSPVLPWVPEPNKK